MAAFHAANNTYPGQPPPGVIYQQQQSNANKGLLQPGQVITINNITVTVEKYLSQGGFAHVYIVQTPNPINNTRQHVLKRIAVSDDAMLREVRKEVEVMRVLRGHPNIVNLIDAASYSLGGGTHEVYILMEFCPGGGIIDMMNRRLRERLTETEIMQIFVDVCEGVACMHNRQPPLLHRDLKVENVLQASATTFKLCDFGSATPTATRGPSNTAEIRAIEADINRHTTMQYRAPEMVDVYLRRPVDEKSDVWALGVFLYKLCYYTTPFEEHGPLAIINVSYRTPPYPVYSSQMNGLIASMLQEHGSQRPSVFELLDVVHLIRGTKSPFRYNRKPSTSHSQPLRPSGLSNPTISTLQPKSQISASAAEARKQVLDAIHPMRRGRPSQGVALMPSAAPLSPIKSGPTKMTNSQSLLPRPQVAQPSEQYTKPRPNDTGAWNVKNAPSTSSDRSSASLAPAFDGFADSFGPSPSLSSSLGANPISPPSLPNRSRPGPPARLHHRTGPIPKRDAFDGLNTSSIAARAPAPTLGSITTANLPVSGTGAGLRSPSAPFAKSSQIPNVSSGSRQLAPPPVQRAISSSPSAELSIEERFPSIEAFEGGDYKSPPASSSSHYTSPNRHAAVSSALQTPAISSPRLTPSPSGKPDTNDRTQSHSRLTTTSNIPRHLQGVRTQQVTGTEMRPPVEQTRNPSGLDVSSVQTRDKSPNSAAIPSPRKTATIQKPLSRRPSTTLNNATGPRTSIYSTPLSSPRVQPADGKQDPSKESGARSLYRRVPTTPITPVSKPPRDWLTGDEPPSPAAPPSRSSSPVRSSSPTRYNVPLSGASSSTTATPTTKQIHRKAPPSLGPGPGATPPRLPRRPSAQPTSGDERSRGPADSSGADDSPEEPTSSWKPRDVPPVSGRVNGGHARRQSSVHDLVDVSSGPSAAELREQDLALRRQIKRQSVHDLVDVSEKQRHARRQTSVHDLVDLSPSSPVRKSFRPTDIPTPTSDSPRQSRFSTARQSLAPSSAVSTASSRYPPTTQPPEPRARPKSMFVPPSSNFLSPPGASSEESLSSASSSGARPTNQRRLSISDMVSKFEALRAPEESITGNHTGMSTASHRIPSGSHAFPRSSNVNGQGRLGPSPSPLLTPTTVSSTSTSNWDQRRSPSPLRERFDISSSRPTTPNRSTSEMAQEDTPRGQPLRGHNRTGSRIVNPTQPPEQNQQLPLRKSTTEPYRGGLANPEKTSPVQHSPSPERPYQGVGKLIDQWQRKTEEAADNARKPVVVRRTGGR